MLVLNRRPGESIIIEPGVVVTVLSVTDRRVWISMDAPGLSQLRLSAVATGPTGARMELGPLAAVSYDGDDVLVALGSEGHPSATLHATLALDRSPGQRITLVGGAWVGLEAVTKGNPCVRFGGTVIGPEFSITLIRPAGNYVRLGVDAPERRVFRRELWDSVRAAAPADGAAAQGHHGTAGATAAAASAAASTLANAEEGRPRASVGAGTRAAGSAG
jgi:sRNA-binding carbon storage regulator CsrA